MTAWKRCSRPYEEINWIWPWEIRVNTLTPKPRVWSFEIKLKFGTLRGKIKWIYVESNTRTIKPKIVLVCFRKITTRKNVIRKRLQQTIKTFWRA